MWSRSDDLGEEAEKKSPSTSPGRHRKRHSAKHHKLKLSQSTPPDISSEHKNHSPRTNESPRSAAKKRSKISPRHLIALISGKGPMVGAENSELARGNRQGLHRTRSRSHGESSGQEKTAITGLRRKSHSAKANKITYEDPITKRNNRKRKSFSPRLVKKRSAGSKASMVADSHLVSPVLSTVAAKSSESSRKRSASYSGPVRVVQNVKHVPAEDRIGRMWPPGKTPRSSPSLFSRSSRWLHENENSPKLTNNPEEMRNDQQVEEGGILDAMSSSSESLRLFANKPHNPEERSSTSETVVKSLQELYEMRRPSSIFTSSTLGNSETSDLFSSDNSEEEKRLLQEVLAPKLNTASLPELKTIYQFLCKPNANTSNEQPSESPEDKLNPKSHRMDRR